MPLDHVLVDARWRDLKPELEQLAVNARCPPERVLDTHLPDLRTDFSLYLRSPSQWARLPAPVAAKVGPMPTHEGLGKDSRENLQD